MSFSIDGKTAIVTGAANGIGLAIARHFLDKGARVMFADMDEDRLDAEVGEDPRGDGPVRMFAGDLREKLTIANLLSSNLYKKLEQYGISEEVDGLTPKAPGA